MGSSTVSFGEKSFEARDPVLEVWLRICLQEMAAVDSLPDWLIAESREWQILSTEEFGFGSAPDLDSVLTDDARRELLLTFARIALERIRTLGDPIPVQVLNSFGAGNPETPFTSDLPAHTFLEAAESFVMLLDTPLKQRPTASQ